MLYYIYTFLILSIIIYYSHKFWAKQNFSLLTLLTPTHWHWLITDNRNRSACKEQTCVQCCPVLFCNLKTFRKILCVSVILKPTWLGVCVYGGQASSWFLNTRCLKIKKCDSEAHSIWHRFCQLFELSYGHTTAYAWPQVIKEPVTGHSVL